MLSTSIITAEEFGYQGSEPVEYVTTTINSENDISVSGYEFEFNHALDYLPGLHKA